MFFCRSMQYFWKEASTILLLNLTFKFFFHVRQMWNKFIFFKMPICLDAFVYIHVFISFIFKGHLCFIKYIHSSKYFGYQLFGVKNSMVCHQYNSWVIDILSEMLSFFANNSFIFIATLKGVANSRHTRDLSNISLHGLLCQFLVNFYSRNGNLLLVSLIIKYIWTVIYVQLCVM